MIKGNIISNTSIQKSYKQQILATMSKIFSKETIAKMIQTHQFRTNDHFDSSPSCLRYLIDYIPAMSVSTATLLLAQKIIKKYRFPILIAFKAFMNKISNGQREFYVQEIEKINSIVQSIIDDRYFPELSFFQSSRKNSKSPLSLDAPEQLVRNAYKMKDTGDKFVNYCHQLSVLCHLITSKFPKMQQITANQSHKILLKFQKFQKILHQGAPLNQKKLTILENYYIHMLRKQVYAQIKYLEIICKENNLNDSLLLIAEKVGKYDEDFYESDSKSTEEEDNQKSIVPKKSIEQNQSNNKRQMVALVDKNENFVPLCCRRFFKLGDIIYELDEDVQMVYADFPFSPAAQDKIRAAFCSLINGKGGFIFINEELKDRTDDKYVTGIKVSENDKEELMKEIRMQIMEIGPDILTNKLYKIDFVPVMKTADRYNPQEQFLQGLYLVRIKVRQGKAGELYSYKQVRQRKEGKDCELEDIFVVRNQGKIVRVEGREMLKLGKARMQSPLSLAPETHQGPCVPPFQGNVYHAEPKESKAPLSQFQQQKNQNLLQNSETNNIQTKKSAIMCQNVNQSNIISQKYHENLIQTRGKQKRFYKKQVQETNEILKPDVPDSLFKSTLTYILEGITIEKAKVQFQKNFLSTQITLESRSNRVVSVSLINPAEAKAFRSVITQLYPKDGAYKGYHIVPITKIFEIQKNDQVKTTNQTLQSILRGNYLIQDGGFRNIYLFDSEEIAGRAYLALREKKVHVTFLIKEKVLKEFNCFRIPE